MCVCVSINRVLVQDFDGKHKILLSAKKSVGGPLSFSNAGAEDDQQNLTKLGGLQCWDPRFFPHNTKSFAGVLFDRTIQAKGMYNHS